jgi:hypothetical protein
LSCHQAYPYIVGQRAKLRVVPTVASSELPA